jgi:hypothetical protein
VAVTDIEESEDKESPELVTFNVATIAPGSATVPSDDKTSGWFNKDEYACISTADNDELVSPELLISESDDVDTEEDDDKESSVSVMEAEANTPPWFTTVPSEDNVSFASVMLESVDTNTEDEDDKESSALSIDASALTPEKATDPDDDKESS